MFSKKLFVYLILLCVGCLFVIAINVSWPSTLLLQMLRNYPNVSSNIISNRDLHDRAEKYKHISGERWIVLTTISYPTPDVKFLANITGWKVVVVGDKKTPRDWEFPNCIYLSLEGQQKLPFETVGYLPLNSYARKTAGYLYAISQGARIVYETDDDNRPQDLLNNFVQERTMWGLIYKGGPFFNPYRHFGQPTLWPRGYPLSSVGENVSTEYVLNHWKTPSIQQGVVNGDPDMDAIFRLTRKQTHSQLNVTFDDRAPPAIVPAGVFSPFNSQNTLFLYDALWALLIPTTTTFRVSDIWRGYWAQRLLWEMGGNLGFFPPNAFQKRNSHSYLGDAVNEKDLYFQTERLVDFLRMWTCEPDKTFFACVTKLSIDMAHENFWKAADADLTSLWIKDLKALGYKEPERIPFGLLQNGVQVTIDSKLPNQRRLTNQQVSLTFWAAEQTPPLIYSTDKVSPEGVSHISQIASYCGNHSFSTLDLNAFKRTITYPNLLLIVVFNFPHYENLAFLETMYSFHFPHIVYCGTNKDQFQNYTKLLLKNVTFIEVDIGGGWFAQNCLIQAMKMQYTVDGYLYIGDDVLLNIWNIPILPLDRLWLFNSSVLQPSDKTNWMWFSNPKVGLKTYQAALAALKLLDAHKYKIFKQMISRNSGKNDSLFFGGADIAYVPNKYKDDVLFFMEHFSKFNLFVEIIFHTVFGGTEKWDNVFRMPGTYLWSAGERDHIEKYYNKNDVFLHPVKISKLISVPKGRRFFCENFLPLTLYTEPQKKHHT
ncbi:probable glycosyltransferase STELLO1 isoform X1 [Haliotis rufescens]|uniref:probable glycosyltransferase STELLO1 isoform X1 n=1 Tax=Haliotis rufescens TaxID=6454 RepID=UPI00201EF5B1|nr:probable glycosyltransferase STELLO1 isoform X1 [Haliotis rufescens]